MFVHNFRASVGYGVFFVLTQFSLAQLSSPLPGSWDLRLKPSSSLTISGLATFTSDGSLVETDSSEVVPGRIVANTFATPGHGIWQPGPAIGNLFVRFTSLAINLNGSLRAKRVCTMTIRLNATQDQFSGAYTCQLVDPTGHAIAFDSGTVAGTRMAHPALP